MIHAGVEIKKALIVGAEESGFDSNTAINIAETQMKIIVSRLGGQQMYMPKGRVKEAETRKAKIKNEYQSIVSRLAKKHDLSERYIQKIVAH